MQCPRCGHELGDGMLPARCPNCGHSLAGAPGNTESVRRAAESRARARGLAGKRADDARYKAPKRYPVMALLGLLALAAVGLIFAWRLELWGGSSLYDMTGWNVERAEKTLVRDGYIVSSETEKADGAEGTVIRQLPAAGTRLEQGAEVHLVVSTPRIMPEVVGKPLSEVELLMKEEGLNFSTEEQISDSDEGVILSCNIAPGKQADFTTDIRFVVSKPRTVPDIIGKSQDEADRMIQDMGCTMKVTYVAPEAGQAEDTVVSCIPAPGERAQAGSTIEVSIVRKRQKEMEETAKAVLGAIYSCNPFYDSEAIGVALRPYLGPSAPSSNRDVWYGMVKRWQELPAGVVEGLGALPRHLDSVNSIEVTDDGTVNCNITVTWDWTVLGAGYEGVYSTDTRNVTLKFDENNKLTSIYDAETDVPSYEMVW